MSKNNAKKNNNYYFPLFMGMGLVFGVILDQIAIGLCLGVAIGLALDNNKKKYLWSLAVATALYAAIF